MRSTESADGKWLTTSYDGSAQHDYFKEFEQEMHRLFQENGYADANEFLSDEDENPLEE
ncbi:MAG: hypothetical protein LUC85_09595 [Bacteroidales bacterium]|nr:hypothetical protein [Bacteroidales bacterium]MCD8395066.1 hypothetical protein [Bacteroidales bacterium]